MDFEAVFRFLLESFQKAKVEFALIGGLAMHAAGYMRATNDIDFLVSKEDMPKVRQIMLSFGYEAVHESEDVSNFVGRLGSLGRVDFLHAHRQYARRMLKEAVETDILDRKFKLKILRAEDLIGLKVQSSSNDPQRYHQDMADIEALMRVNHEKLDLSRIKEYFALFEREDELKSIVEKLDKC